MFDSRMTTMKGFIVSIADGKKGLVFGNSVFLPFHLELISVWIGKEMSLLSAPDIVVDLCDDNDDVAVREGCTYTNLVFRKYRDLARDLGNDKCHIVLYAAEKGSDIFPAENRHYIRLEFQLRSKEISLDIIDDPFTL
jgi:hypothetical protein